MGPSEPLEGGMWICSAGSSHWPRTPALVRGLTHLPPSAFPQLPIFLELISFARLWRQLENSSRLELSEAVAGENMMRYFSFRQRRHICVVVLYTGARHRTRQVMVCGRPASFSLHLLVYIFKTF